MLELLALAWLLGSGAVALGAPLWLAPAAGLLPLAQRTVKPTPSTVARAVLLAALALGAASLFAHRQPSAAANDVSHFIGVEPARLRGTVNGDRDVRARSLVLRLDVSRVEDGQGVHSAGGTVLLRLPLSADYEDGDVLDVRGKIVAPTSSPEFDYREYLARAGVYAEVDYPTTRRLARASGPSWRHVRVVMRQRLDEGIRSVLPQPEASLGSSIAFGTRAIVDPRFSRELSDTDAMMLAFATGYNVTVVGLFTFAFLTWLIGRRWAVPLSILVVLAYACLLGGYPSIVRAAVMVSVVLAAALAGRPHSSVRALVLASAVMVAVDPQALRSVSFPLSLAATGGAVVLADPLRDTLRRLVRAGPEAGAGWRTWPADSAALTLAVIGPSYPVIVAALRGFSIPSLPMNLLLFPLLPPLTIVCILTGLAGAVWHAGAQILAPCAYLLLHLMTLTVHATAAVPGNGLRTDWAAPQWAVVLASLTALLAAPLPRAWGARRMAARALTRTATPPARPLVEDTARLSEPIRPARERPSGRAALAGAAVAACLGSLALVAWTAAPERVAAHPSLQVTDLDVGPGSAILVQAGGSRILVDGGPPGEATVRALDERLPPWERSVNLIVITQATSDHVGGLSAVLARYRVGAVVDASSGGGRAKRGDAAWQSWERALEASGVRVLPSGRATVRAGDAVIEITPAAAGRSKNPSPAATVVARLGRRQLLLAGDATASIASDVRVVFSSGENRPATPARVELLQTGDPARAAAELVAVPVALREALVYRTLENGSIVLQTDGRGLTVRVDRGPRLGLFRPAR